jgi:hypothetical protein
MDVTCACCAVASVVVAGTCARCAVDNGGDGRICSTCFSKHSSQKGRFAAHVAVVADTAEATLLVEVGLPSAPNMCSAHAHKEAEVFCEEPGCAGSGHLMCTLCAISGHKGHRITTLGESAEARRNEILSAVGAPCPPSAEAANVASEATLTVAAARRGAVSVAALRAALPQHAATAQQRIDSLRDTMIGQAHSVHTRLSEQLRESVAAVDAGLADELMAWDGVLATARTATVHALQVRRR